MEEVAHDTGDVIAAGKSPFPEYLDFLRLIEDEAGDRLILVHHASFSTLEQNIEAVRGAQDTGAELVLLSYPPNFYPETEKEIHDYTKAVCNATNCAHRPVTVHTDRPCGTDARPLCVRGQYDMTVHSATR